MSSKMNRPKTTYLGVYSEEDTGKLCLTSNGLIYYPEADPSRKLKMGWGSLASERLDPLSYSLVVSHSRGTDHLFQMMNETDFRRIEEDLTSRLEAYYENQRLQEAALSRPAPAGLVASSHKFAGDSFASSQVSDEAYPVNVRKQKYYEMQPLKEQVPLDTDDEVDEGDKPDLPEGFAMVELDANIYSLIFTSPVCGPGFFFALIIFGFQTAITGFVLKDALNLQNDNNPLKIPPGNDLTVIAGQGMLMLILPQIVGDMLEGLEFLMDGYHGEVLDVCPHANIWKWFMAGFLHTASGALMIVDVFTLLMQQKNVVGLALIYAAFGFFANIDNLAFKIGGRGVCSVPLQNEIKAVGKVTVRKNQHYTWLRQIRDLLLAAVLMAGYGIIVHQQSHGKFLCDTLFVQFGDFFDPDIVEFSGMFDMLGFEEKHDRRFVYKERSAGTVVLGYCEEMTRWTMTDFRNDTYEPCGSATARIYARSGVDPGYSILTTKNTWQVESANEPFVHFYMECNECENKCGAKGICDETGRCVCQEGYYGLNCEYASPCPNMTLDMHSKPFDPTDKGFTVFPTEFNMLTMADGSRSRNGTFQIEYRPVYYGEHGFKKFLMFFAGRRWVITQETDGKQGIVDYFSEPGFSLLEIEYEPYFASGVMDAGTSSDQATPDHLAWFHVRKNGYNDDVIDKPWWEAAEESPTGTVFHCALCDKNTNPCEGDGQCQEDQTCLCSDGFVGSLCEYEVKCTDLLEEDVDQRQGCLFQDDPRYNVTCQASGRCSGCPFGYIGSRCQNPLDCGEFTEFDLEGADGGCLNNGTCAVDLETNIGNCTCPDPYSGPLCQFRLPAAANPPPSNNNTFLQ